MLDALKTPWKITNYVRQVISTPFVRLQFQIAGVSWGYGWRIYGFPNLQIHRDSTVKIGDHLQLRNFRQSNPLSPTTPVTLSARNADTLITIGDHFSMTGGGGLLLPIVLKLEIMLL